VLRRLSHAAADIKKVSMHMLSIGRRLAVGFGLLLVLSVVTTLMGVWQLQSASVATQSIIEKTLGQRTADC
jgi:methyl-accepting chemotaxis protein